MYVMTMTVGGIFALLLDALTTLIVVEWAVSWLVVLRVLSELLAVLPDRQKTVGPDS